MILNFFKKGAALATVILMMGAFPNTASAIPAGWTGTGSFGTLGANGVVTAPPNGDATYDWVSTNGGVDLGDMDLGIPPGSETNGSTLLTGMFTAAAGDALEFDFNYVTSDGEIYIEYAWAQILDSVFTPVDLLFTARTTTGGANTVPGNGLGTIAATMTPASTPIIDGAPDWSPLGEHSGTCFGDGCGYTGWIHSSYDIVAAGDYHLLFGVTNWLDTDFDSGMAISGATVGGKDIDDTTPTCGPGTDIKCDEEPPPGGGGSVPEPSIIALFALGLLGLGFARRRKA